MNINKFQDKESIMALQEAKEMNKHFN